MTTQQPVRTRPSRGNADYDYFIKIVLVGNSAVGKSSLMIRYTDDQFKEAYSNTIGVDFRFKTVIVDGARVKLQIWDTAGQEKFRTITATYYKGADAVILVYDMTDERSFKEIESYWVEEIKKNVSEISTFMILGNKADLQDKKVVDPAMAQRLTIGSSPCIFFEVSAKSDQNVQKAFEELARQYIAKRLEKRKAKKEELSGKMQSQQSGITEEDKADIYSLHMQLSEKDKQQKKENCNC